MQRIFFITFFIISSFSKAAAQDTIKLNGQPKWLTGLDIGDYCLFYEEPANKTFSFKEVKEQSFIPYRKELRLQKFSNQPLIIQWLKFTIQNTSATDTVDLHINTVHYFTRLYNDNKLLGVSGAYEARNTRDKSATLAFTRSRLPVILPPNTTTTYWFRSEDRQNQLIPPQVILETIFIGMREEVKTVFAARYLFLIMAAMAGCFFFIGIYALYNFYLYRHISFM